MILSCLFGSLGKTMVPGIVSPSPTGISARLRLRAPKIRRNSASEVLYLIGPTRFPGKIIQSLTGVDWTSATEVSDHKRAQLKTFKSKRNRICFSRKVKLAARFKALA
jgi:hypothetical protein